LVTPYIWGKRAVTARTSPISGGWFVGLIAESLIEGHLPKPADAGIIAHCITIKDSPMYPQYPRVRRRSR
jgi:hypothetical protein